MMDHDSLISVIIPVYNGELYLEEAIESVLGQTYRPLEVIVVDDGSTDGSAAVARHFSSLVSYHYQPQSGTGTARNRGVELAKGKFLAFLDADDLWVPDKLTRQMAALETNLELDMVFGLVEQFQSPELTDGMKYKERNRVMNGLHVGAMLIRRIAFERVGFFATAWRVVDFIDWYARAMELGLKGMVLSGVVMRRRLHATNLGIRERELAGREYARVLKALLERRRKNS